MPLLLESRQLLCPQFHLGLEWNPKEIVRGVHHRVVHSKVKVRIGQQIEHFSPEAKALRIGAWSCHLKSRLNQTIWMSRLNVIKR